jgi:acetate kinase
MIGVSKTKTLHISVAEEILNRHSGWKALTGTTLFSQIAVSSLPECRLAFNMFVDRIIGFVGSYYTKLEGKVDALVFSGGVGEDSALLRQAVVDGCRCLGFTLDQIKNEETRHYHGTVVEIGEHRHVSKRVLVCHTDEQVSDDPTTCRIRAIGSDKADTSFCTVGDGPRMRDPFTPRMSEQRKFTGNEIDEISTGHESIENFDYP